MSRDSLPIRWIGSDVDSTTVPGIPMDREIDSCPHCGSDVYHIRMQVTGTIREHHAFDERPVDNSDMWNSVQMRQRATIYCSECERPIAKAVG